MTPYEIGRRDAQRDVSHGVLALEAFGAPRSGFSEYEKLLKQKYGIIVRWVAGNDVSHATVEHWKGYNQVAKVEIERRFGTNVLKQTQAEARALHDEKNH